MSHRYLTKSLFITAMECPAKLFYSGKPEYANQKIEDSFLMALAEGGFQVGELARCYIHGGCRVAPHDYTEALRQTAGLLKRDRVIIYEAAIRYNDFFIRTDILIKEGSHLELIEVKAKSTDEADEECFLTKSGSVSSAWMPYILDIAFQKHVLRRAFPDFDVSAFLMLADKRMRCPSDGLNQKFRIIKDMSGRKRIAPQDLSDAELSEPILCKVNVDGCCEAVYRDRYGPDNRDYAGYADFLADCYKNDIKIKTMPSASCGKCEFTADGDDQRAGLLSGFRTCWKEHFGWQDRDFSEPTIFDIWNLRNKDRFIQQGRVKMSDITINDISFKSKSNPGPGLSAGERQWLQISKAQNNDRTVYIDSDNLKREMESWVYPLHFIDFETTMAAIPFNRGRHPYEGIAFQYSQHTVSADGRIEHKGQYLNTEPGKFPNYDFVRNLKKELENDGGSILRYAAHENTYLVLIHNQLMAESGEPDREELCAFIRTITRAQSDSKVIWEDGRNMIDMLDLVKRYYYDPAMKGSNSIKQVLPAILNGSAYLQAKYSRPIYGSHDGITSLNYTDWKWIEYENGRITDPYKLLPKMFRDASEKELSLLSDSDEIKEGGAAMTAYARMQFEEMSDYERTEIRNALLKYCELDTMAMVMIYEGWQDLYGMKQI